MTGRDAAAVLSELATLGEINGDNAFRTRAFANAARALEGSDADLDALARAGELTSLPGVGEGIAEVIREVVETGESTLLTRLRASTPAGLFDMLRLPGLGAKRIHTLHEKLGVETLAALEQAASRGRIAKLSGFGAKTEQKILDGIAFVRTTRGRRRFNRALEVGVRLHEWLQAQPGVAQAEVAGDLRRRMETVGAVELVVETTRPAAVIRALAKLNGVGEVETANTEGTFAARLPDGLPVRVRCVPKRAFGAALLHATGNEAHLAELAARAEQRGLTLTEDGLRKANRRTGADTEEDIYRALELAWVPPELREGSGEVAAAAARTLPQLVRLTDLHGTFHCHTTYSDGKATVAEMAEAARAKGWSYLGIADHSRVAAYAGGLVPAAVRKQQREIDAWNAEHGKPAAGKHARKRFHLFKGTEADILADGTLDYDHRTLGSFDYVVGSVHSAFTLSEPDQTDRVLRAIENPHLTMLGHATGRLLLTREGYAIDVRAVIDAAAEHGVAIEINADPHRLDLDWRHIRYAADRGVLIPINPDAHSVAGLDNVAFGVGIARKGWLQPREVLNAWTLDEVEGYFAERKQGR